MSKTVIVEISARHIHLSEQDLKTLFGPDACLHSMKMLSQPGEFAAEERVDLKTAKGVLSGVRILGPTRKQTQVEISPADARKIGINPPVRDSGDLDGSASATLIGPAGQVELSQGVIIAARHIHLDTATAESMGFKDGQRVKASVPGLRPVIFDDVLIRVSPKYAPAMHIDTDEGNACLVSADAVATIIA